MSFILFKYLFTILIIINQFNQLESTQNRLNTKLLRFESEPESIYTELNKKVQLKCLVRPKKARIQWLVNEEPVKIDDKAIFTTVDSLIIQLPDRIDLNVGVYTFDELIKSEIQCKAEHKNQTLLSSPAKIIVAFINDFPLVDEEIKVDVKENQIAVIPCRPPNSPPKVVTSFIFNQNKLIESNDEKYHLMPSGDLQIFNVSMEDTGKYQCLAFNPWLRERKNSSSLVTLHVEKQFINQDELNKDTFAIEKLDFLTKPKEKYSAIRGTELQIFECVASSILPVNINWFREDKKPLPRNRFKIVGGNLILNNIQTTDQGVYICEATNGHKKIIATSELEVKQTASIKTELESKLVQINDQIEFECSVNGYPIPKINWYFNGLKLINSTDEIEIEKTNENTSKLKFKKVNEQHQGIIQCFASNDLLTVYSVGRLEVVNDLNDQSSSSSINNNGDSNNNKLNNNNNNKIKPKLNKNRNRNKTSNDLTIPGKPKIIRLTSDSVIVHWKMPKQIKSPITFFKIQYKDLHQFNQTTDWQTVEEDIPPNINSYSITQLQSDKFYKFRIMAVYKNQDSQDGRISERFFLAKNPIQKRPTTTPQIIQSKSDSSNSIEIYWDCTNISNNDDQYDGFLIHYRPIDSANTFFKITIDNNRTREHTITNLFQSKQYQIKMQTYNSGGVGDFSREEIVRTLAAVGSDEESLLPDGEGGVDEEPDSILPQFPTKENDNNNNNNNLLPTNHLITPSTKPNNNDSIDQNLRSIKPTINELPDNKIDSVVDDSIQQPPSLDNQQEKSKIDPLSTDSPLFYIIIGLVVLIIMIVFVYALLIIKRSSNRKSKSNDDKFDLDDENFILKPAEDDSLTRGFNSKMNSLEPIYSNGGVLSSNPHLTKKAIKNYNHNYATIGGRKNDVYDSSSINVRINKFCDDSITSSLLAVNKAGNQINKRDLPNRTSTISHYNLTRPNQQQNFNTIQQPTNLPNIHNKNLLLPNLPETRTLGRQRQSNQRNFEDLYGTTGGTHFATINRSNSMARLNGGTLERRRKTVSSKNDLFSVLNIQEENEDLQQLNQLNQHHQQQQQQLQNYRVNGIKSVRYVNNNMVNNNMTSSLIVTGNGFNNTVNLNNSGCSNGLNNSSLNSNMSNGNNIMNSTMNSTIVNNYDLQNLPNIAAYSTIQQQQQQLQLQQQPNLMTNITTSNNSSNNKQIVLINGMMQTNC